jgi:hypothetical protein
MMASQMVKILTDSYLNSHYYLLALSGCMKSIKLVHDQTKAQFVANAVHVEMQRCHFYTIHHAAKAANAATVYRAKHGIVDIDMG